jgi:CHASE3 domain sensor protein
MFGFGCTLTFQSKLIGGVSAAAALLLFVAGLSYWRLARNREDRQRVVHTYQVMGQLDGILQGMTDAETGERGYILTGDNSYLAPYQRGLSEVRQSTAAVRKLTSDNLKQQRSLGSPA